MSGIKTGREFSLVMTSKRSLGDATAPINREELKAAILQSLCEQGFKVQNDRIVLPPGLDKDGIRALHAHAVRRQRERLRRSLERIEPKLLRRVASGAEIEPEKIRPVLVEVKRDSEDELFFRWAAAHWSIPVSSGYGRRLRFLVVDAHNGKVMGLLGLGDPVFSLAPRDRWIGWDAERKRAAMKYVMDAFVLGAIPPYSMLLIGKLVAMLVTSNEVRQAFTRKYGGRTTVISGEPQDGQLALVTTTSALGRSSLYRRIKYRDRLLYHPLGFTRGAGEFHFANGLYDVMVRFVTENCRPTAKHARWGKGFRNRREVINKCLKTLGISTELVYHGIQREVFGIPLAENACAFLRGEARRLVPYHHPVNELFDFFRERWLLSRAARDRRYRDFTPDRYALWSEGRGGDGGRGA